MKRKIVVLCGSMKVKDEILKIKEKLENKNYEVLLPIECMQGLPKEIASRAHFDRIQDKKTDIVLKAVQCYTKWKMICELGICFCGKE